MVDAAIRYPDPVLLIDSEVGHEPDAAMGRALAAISASFTGQTTLRS